MLSRCCKFALAAHLQHLDSMLRMLAGIDVSTCMNHIQFCSGVQLTKEATLKGEQYSLQPHLGQFSVSRRSVDQQIQQLERWSKGLKTAALVLGATGLVFAGIAYALKGYRFYRRKKRL